MHENHEGEKLRQYIALKNINVERDVLPKLDGVMSKATFFKQYHLDTIKAEYKAALLKAGFDFMGQATRLKPGLQFSQREAGLGERVKALEAQVYELHRSLLDLYSRLPKQEGH